MVTVINPPSNTNQRNDATNGHDNRAAKAAHPAGGGGGDNDKPRGGGSGGGADNGGDHDDNYQHEIARSRYRIGLTVLFVTIVMMFAALTITYLLTSSNANWRPLRLPLWTWTSTILLVSSSLTIELARRAWRRNKLNAARKYLFVTATLGLTFILSQLMSWRELFVEGVFLRSNPHSSFFYLLTGIHALHIIGGICALGYLVVRALRSSSAPDTRIDARGAIAFDAGALYWHFVDLLWIYVLFLLLWR